MYIFDLNRSTADCRSNVYIPVCHTNRRPIRNTIGVVKNRLVGMALKIPINSYFYVYNVYIYQEEIN